MNTTMSWKAYVQMVSSNQNREILFTPETCILGFWYQLMGFYEVVRY